MTATLLSLISLTHFGVLLSLPLKKLCVALWQDKRYSNSILKHKKPPLLNSTRHMVKFCNSSGWETINYSALLQVDNVLLFGCQDQMLEMRCTHLDLSWVQLSKFLTIKKSAR
jgi:hypothetical protein